MSKKLRCIKEAHRAGKGRTEHQNSGRRHVGPLALSTGDPAVLRLVAQSCLTLCDPMDYSLPGSSVHRDSLGKNTGLGCHALLQGIFPSQGLNSGLLHCRWTLYHVSHQESPRILDWVAYPFSRGSSQPRNHTGVSCIAGGFFSSWATRETLCQHSLKEISCSSSME